MRESSPLFCHISKMPFHNCSQGRRERHLANRLGFSCTSLKCSSFYAWKTHAHSGQSSTMFNWFKFKMGRVCCAGRARGVFLPTKFHCSLMHSSDNYKLISHRDNASLAGKVSSSQEDGEEGFTNPISLLLGCCEHH